MAASAGRIGGVRALERGLDLLMALGRLRSASVIDLAQATGLPRPTIYRLLETLQSAGLVARNEADRYRLTQRIRMLSDGYDEEEWVGGIARPVLEALGREVAWPISLFTFDAGRMLVRETTHHQSALSVDYGMVGQRLPMLKTAAGRAYLASCPEKERSAILLLLAGSDDPDDGMIRDPRRVAGLLRAVRADGYAVQEREINSRTASFSIPILAPPVPAASGSRVLGCVSVIWIASALTVEQSVRRYGPLVQRAATRIAEAWERATSQDRSSAAAARHGGTAAEGS